MKITKGHIQFYYAKKIKSPSFGRLDVPDINGLINASAGIKHDLDKHNTFNLLKRKKSFNDLYSYLVKISYNPGTIINPKKRIFIARRLMKKLIKLKFPKGIDNEKGIKTLPLLWGE